ncbi:hypothetical protein, partial [Escherichia coli]|uniref:hypothetical protein n=1 Tax=Escherichia coli TaxID=562 RepID=UPI000B924AC2
EKALNEGLAELHRVKTQWADITAFFSGVVKVLKVVMVGDIGNMRTAAQSLKASTLSRFITKSVGACVSAVRITMLSEAYLEISRNHLEAYVTELGLLVTDSACPKAKFDDLAARCEGAKEDIEGIIEENKRELLGKIEEEIEQLRN